MASNTYDELGRLQSKKRHTNADTETYAYNVRSWPTSITSGGFTENLYYNTNPINTNLSFNGNISYSTWTYNGTTRAYLYEYDNLNRLLSSRFKQGSSGLGDDSFNETFEYDKMGNISTLTRKKNNTQIDNLIFHYTNNEKSNQLQYIDDSGATQGLYSIKEYQNISATQTEFAYDVNGNMIKDLDRNIVTIRYNVLNLPEVVQFKNGNQIKNTYNAGGQKLGTEYFTQLTNITPLADGQVINQSYSSGVIDQSGMAYIGNIEYKTLNGISSLTTLNRIHNEEGYVENISNPQYYYFRKDHLGNNREVWLANTNTAIQRTQYYPSGLPWAESTGASLQPYKFNGCEFIEMHGLDVTDLGNRGVHNAKNRFDTMDRFCEKFPWQSPYIHAGNNPVNYVDVNGDSIVLTGDNVQQTIMAIYNGMADGTKVNMRFNNGVLDPSSIADQTQNISDFFLKDLYEIAINPQMVELSIKGTFDYKDNDGNTRNSHDGSTPLLEWTTPYDYSDDDDPKIKQDAIYRGDYKQGKTVQGGTGKSLFTVSNTGQRSTNDNIQIIVNANGSINHRTIGLFHEFQHVLLKFREQKYTHSDPGVTDIIENRVILMKRRLGYDY